MTGSLLRLRGYSISVDSTLVTGVVNASPESFSDRGRSRILDGQRRLAESLVYSGADIMDIGSPSAITGQPELSADDELQQVLPIVRWVHKNFPDTIVSVDDVAPAVDPTIPAELRTVPTANPNLIEPSELTEISEKESSR